MVEVVKFQTPNCRPCREVQFILDRLAEQLVERGVIFTTVNAVEDPERTKSLGIISAPTVVVFKDGYETHRFVGTLFKETDYLAAIESLLPSNP
jgi:thioredoxin 1